MLLTTDPHFQGPYPPIIVDKINNTTLHMIANIARPLLQTRHSQTLPVFSLLSPVTILT